MPWVPRDHFWPRRVPVAQAGQCVPFHLMLLWHWQFFLDGHSSAPNHSTP